MRIAGLTWGADVAAVSQNQLTYYLLGEDPPLPSLPPPTHVYMHPAPAIALVHCPAGYTPPVPHAVGYGARGYEEPRFGAGEPPRGDLFSPGFGGDFISWSPARFAVAAAGRAFSSQGAEPTWAWLVNTGWMGSPCGEGGMARRASPIPWMPERHHVAKKLRAAYSRLARLPRRGRRYNTVAPLSTPFIRASFEPSSSIPRAVQRTRGRAPASASSPTSGCSSPATCALTEGVRVSF